MEVAKALYLTEKKRDEYYKLREKLHNRENVGASGSFKKGKWSASPVQLRSGKAYMGRTEKRK